MQKSQEFYVLTLFTAMTLSSHRENKNLHLHLRKTLSNMRTTKLNSNLFFFGCCYLSDGFVMFLKRPELVKSRVERHTLNIQTDYVVDFRVQFTQMILN